MLQHPGPHPRYVPPAAQPLQGLYLHPKPNGYQSLHTTVIGHEGIPFEVQIRTRKMDEQAEYGVAAHWKYKEGLDGHDKLDERLAWVSQLLENQRVSGTPATCSMT